MITLIFGHPLTYFLQKCQFWASLRRFLVHRKDIGISLSAAGENFENYPSNMTGSVKKFEIVPPEAARKMRPVTYFEHPET